MSLSLGIKDLKEKRHKQQKDVLIKKPILKMIDELASSVKAESGGDLIALIFEIGYDSTSESNLNDVSYVFSIFPRMNSAYRTDLFRIVFPQNGNPRFETNYNDEHPGSVYQKEIESEESFKDTLNYFVHNSQSWKNVLTRLLDQVGD
jgi:hypothetical protein